MINDSSDPCVFQQESFPGSCIYIPGGPRQLIVTQDSAVTIPGSHGISMARDHRGLVKFSKTEEECFTVRRRLKTWAQKADGVVRAIFQLERPGK